MIHSPARRRVVVTGIGAISPLGLDAETTWANVLAGVSGIGPITRFDATDFKTRFAGEVKGFDPDAAVGRKDARRMDRYCQLGVAAAIHAGEDSGLTAAPADPNRTGALIATVWGQSKRSKTAWKRCWRKGQVVLAPSSCR